MYVLFGFYARDLITGGIFIPHHFRGMFMEYWDNCIRSNARYVAARKVLHKYVRIFPLRNEYLHQNMKFILSPFVFAIILKYINKKKSILFFKFIHKKIVKNWDHMQYITR